MTFAPLGHTPYPWYNGPSGGTAVNATNLMAAEDDLIAYAQQDDLEVVSYFESGGSNVVLADTTLSGGTSDSVIYVSKYINSGNYASTSAAVQAAHDALPADGGTLQLPPGVLTLNNVSITKAVVIQGVQGQTRLLPGASGTIITFTYGHGSIVEFRDIMAGDDFGATSPNRSYATPLFIFNGFTGHLNLSGLYVWMSGTGTIFYFSTTGNLRISAAHIYSGFYAIPFLFDDLFNTAAFLDTIRFEWCEVQGSYFAMFRTPVLGSTPTYNVIGLDQVKQVNSDNNGNPGKVLLDDSLSYSVGFGEVAAGATSIQVATVGWAVDDNIYIEGDYATDGTSRTGGTAEVNRVTGVSGSGPYVLTLAEPLTFNHGTNAGAFHVQVLRGGVGLSIGQSIALLRVQDLHTELLAWNSIDYGSAGQTWDCIYKGSHRMIRLAGATTDVKVGLTYPAGISGENHVLDLPAWNTAACDRFTLEGPWVHSTPTVLDGGTSLTLDILATGTVFATKNFTTTETLVGGGSPRVTEHAPTGNGTRVLHRFSVGTTTDSMDLQAGGAITGSSATLSTASSKLFKSTLTGGGTFSQGSGVPATPNGTNPVAGDIYFRTDTPSTANQRIYICTTGGASPVWSGIV